MEKDILWSLELAEAQLSDDIKFLHCLSEEYFAFNEPQESYVYLYQQLSSAITTVIKSMEYNQKEMKENIDKYFNELKTKN